MQLVFILYGVLSIYQNQRVEKIKKQNRRNRQSRKTDHRGLVRLVLISLTFSMRELFDLTFVYFGHESCFPYHLSRHPLQVILWMCCCGVTLESRMISYLVLVSCNTEASQPLRSVW